MNRGEIRWYKFQAPDKRRPVLILTRDAIIEYLGEVTIAPVTSTVRDIPSEVVLSHRDGMARECAVNCDHIQTISKNKLGALVGVLTPVKMAEVDKAIHFALDLQV